MAITLVTIVAAHVIGGADHTGYAIAITAAINIADAINNQTTARIHRTAALILCHAGVVIAVVADVAAHDGEVLLLDVGLVVGA